MGTTLTVTRARPLKPAASDEAIVEVVKAAIHLTDAALAAAAPMFESCRDVQAGVAQR